MNIKQVVSTTTNDDDKDEEDGDLCNDNDLSPTTTTTSEEGVGMEWQAIEITSYDRPHTLHKCVTIPPPPRTTTTTTATYIPSISIRIIVILF